MKTYNLIIFFIIILKNINLKIIIKIYKKNHELNKFL